MMRNNLKLARSRGRVVVVLGVVALLAACDAKMPTSADIAAMDVGSFEHRLGALGLVPDQAVYFVNGTRVARTEAAALKPEEIASVNVSKIDTTNYVDVRTIVVHRSRDEQHARRRRVGPEPLIIIDGVPSMEATVKALDPGSIESISVIKGLAAVREFGPDATGGVIRIVTKAGTKR
jgi:hypothetical protein